MVLYSDILSFCIQTFHIVVLQSVWGHGMMQCASIQNHYSKLAQQEGNDPLDLRALVLHIWSQVVTTGNNLSNLVHLWSHLVTTGPIWSHQSPLVTTGHPCHIWSHLITTGHTWSQLVTSGHNWSQLVPTGP